MFLNLTRPSAESSVKSGTIPGKQLAVLDLPGHERLRHPGPPEDGDALAELPQRHPVHLRRSPAGGQLVDFWTGLFSDGDDGHVVAQAARRFERQEGKLAVACD